MLDSYKVLEFPRILNSIAGTCRTEIAKKKILHLEMYDNLDDLNEEQNRLEEAMTIHRIMGTLPLAPLNDISAYLAKAKKDGVSRKTEKNLKLELKDDYVESEDDSRDAGITKMIYPGIAAACILVIAVVIFLVRKRKKNSLS